MTTVSLTWLDDAITAIFEAAGFSTEAARTAATQQARARLRRLRGKDFSH